MTSWPGDRMLPQIHFGRDVSSFSLQVRYHADEAYAASRNGKLDDASAANIKALQDKAQELIHAKRDRIKELRKVLAEPKAKLRPKSTRPLKNFSWLPSETKTTWY
jgi:hypothetical protein